MSGSPRNADAGRGSDQGSLIAGRYRLHEVLGSGGMGTVWRAEDELLGRHVALKKMRMPPQFSDDERERLYERTRREARSAARITHPNVIVVHDVVDDVDSRAAAAGGTGQSLPCIVMEYVPSLTLADVLRERGPLPAAEAARIGRRMAAALRAAHAAGVLHRDVKPGNVLLGAEGRVVLTDFGIAMSADTSTLTRTGEIVGSVGYLAPERVRGRTPGPASDLWSLGATLFEAIEGQSPFRRASAMETVYAIAADPLPPLTARGPVAELTAELLRKEPESRPHAEEVERRLRAAAAAAPDTPDTPYAEERTEALPSGPGVGGFGPAAQPLAGHPAAAPDPRTPSPRPAPQARTPEPHSAPQDRTHEQHHAPQNHHPAGDETPVRPLSTTAPPATPKRRAPLYAALAVALVAALGAGGLLYLQGQDEGRKPDATPGASGTSPGATDGASGSAEPTDAKPTDKPEPTGTPSDDEPPSPTEGYQVKDVGGFPMSMPVPVGWTEKTLEDGSTAYIDPSGLVRLQVSTSDWEGLGPEAHFEKDEAASQAEGKLPGYQRIRLDPTEFRVGPAAVWEFSFEGKARSFRAIDLAFDDEDANEYALYLSAPADQWERYVPVYETARDGIDFGQ